MIVRAIDGSGDWFWGKGRNDYKSGTNAIAQTIRTRLLSFLGDCFFSATSGIDWFNLLGTKNQLAIDLAVSATILNTPNVISLIELSAVLDRVTRALRLSYSVKVDSGTIIETVTISSGAGALTTEDGLVLTTESGEIITVEEGN